MLRGGSSKSANEVRFELVVVGTMLVVGVLMYVAFQESPSLQPLIIFFPGLILLGGCVYQTITPNWKAGWITYVIAILMLAIGLAGLINAQLGEIVHVDWWVVAIAALGVLMIIKALYDPNPRD